MILTVDFAAKFSAGIVRERGGRLVYQFDSWGKDILEFCEEAAQAAADYEVTRAVFEDVPYGLSKQFQIKPPLRGQGIVIDEFHRLDMLDTLRWLSPSVWQRTFDGVWKGGVKGARAAAERLGYTPPDLLEVHAEEIPPPAPENTKARAAIRTKLRKAMTDYDAAYLMSEWAWNLTVEEIDAATQPSFPDKE